MNNANAPGFAALACVCAARLRGQGALAAFSLLLSALAWAALATSVAGWRPPGGPVLAALGAAALLGLAERYLAVRLAIDAQLFGDLARGTVADLSVLDQALAQLALAPPAKAGRTLTERTAGALRLVRWHSRVVGLQLVLLLAAAAIAVRMAPGAAA